MSYIKSFTTTSLSCSNIISITTNVAMLVASATWLPDWEGYPNLTAAVLNNLLAEREQAVAGLLHAD